MSSLSLRLAVMFGLATTLVTLAISSVLFAVQDAELERHTRAELHGRFVIVERTLQYASEHDWPRLRGKLADFSHVDGSLLFVVNSADANYQIGAPLQVTEDGFGSARVGAVRCTTLAGPIPAKGMRPQVTFVIAVDQAHQRYARTVLATGIVSASLVTVIAMTSLGWWIARRGLAPVDRLSLHARELGVGDLTLRLPRDVCMPRELEGMILSFNGALDRLQGSHQKLSDFNADVAHELRTPLANMLVETELALKRKRDPDELKATLQSNMEEVVRLRGMINSMLFLARADAGDEARDLGPRDLQAECQRVVEYMTVLFDEIGSCVEIEGHARACIEPALFGQALHNLLDNALRHGAGGRVRVQLHSDAHRVSLTVVNPGRPIGAHALSRIFDRFYCEDPSRRSDGRSHGLGLAIVKAIAKMHGGDVHAQNVAGGVAIGFYVPSSCSTRIGSVRKRRPVA